LKKNGLSDRNYGSAVVAGVRSVGDYPTGGESPPREVIQESGRETEYGELNYAMLRVPRC